MRKGRNTAESRRDAQNRLTIKRFRIMPMTMATKMDLKSLKEATGHVLVVEDFDDIEKLDAINRRIAEGEDCAESIAARHAVRVGNILLEKPRIGAIEWFEAHAEWFADDAALCDCAFVFAGQARHPRTLWALTDKNRARRAVRRFMRALSCTSEELQEGFARLFGVNASAVTITQAPDPKEVEKSCATIANAAKMNHEATYNAIKSEAARLEKVGNETPNYGPLVAMLCREFGGDPEKWRWDMPMHIVESCRKDFEARVDAQEREIAKANKGAAVLPQKTTRNLLIKEARLMRNEIKARWEATDGS